MPASVRQFFFCRWHLLNSGPWAHWFGTLIKIDNVFRPSDALLTSHIRGICYNPNFTRHTYLTSCHLISLLFQASTKQLFLKTPFLKAHVPCSTTACVYTLVDPLQPVCTYKSTKNGKLLTEHTVLGKLTKPFDHAWLVTQLNT
jgi:hypothetical protein